MPPKKKNSKSTSNDFYINSYVKRKPLFLQKDVKEEGFLMSPQDIQRLQKNVDALKELNDLVDQKRRKGIDFNQSTGAVSIFGDEIGELVPGSRDFYFFKVLYEAIPNTVDYKELAYKTMKEFKGGNASSKDIVNYCQSVRSDINKYSPAIANLIDRYVTKDGEPGYRLRNSKHQKRARR